MSSTGGECTEIFTDTCASRPHNWPLLDGIDSGVRNKLRLASPPIQSTFFFSSAFAAASLHHRGWPDNIPWQS